MEDFILSDAIKEKLRKAENLDDVMKICNEEGYEVTKEDLVLMMSSLNEDELNEDDLVNVTGGGVVRRAHEIVAPVILAMCVYFKKQARR